MAFEIFTLKERPELRSRIFAAAFQPPFFPEFMVHDRTAKLYFSAPFFDAYLGFAFAATPQLHGFERGQTLSERNTLRPRAGLK
jgi:hypothetical protein